MSGCRAVVFDFYWTLAYEEETGVGERAEALAAQAGADEEAWRRAWHSTVEASMRGEVSLLGRVRMALQKAGAAERDGTLVEDLAGLMNARSMPRLYPDVRACLSELQERGYELGLVSNIATYRANWIEEFDLAEHFRAVVLSCEMGMLKPEREMYLAAARGLNLSAEECVFVDDVPSYVAGAKAVGMRGVRINRFDSEARYASDPHTEISPDLSIKELGELLQWLPVRAERP